MGQNDPLDNICPLVVYSPQKQYLLSVENVNFEMDRLRRVFYN